MRRWIVLLGAAAFGCGGGEIEVVEMACADVVADLATRRAAMTTTASGLMIEELTAGRGKAAEAGQHVHTHYVLCSSDGNEIDSSLAPGRGVPIDFDLGTGAMIAGYDEGVQGMKVGGRRILVLPPEIAYGSSTLPGQAPGSDLVFHVQLMSIDAPE